MIFDDMWTANIISSPKTYNLPAYPLVNSQFDPENDQFMETSLPTPNWQGRTVNLLEGITHIYKRKNTPSIP